MNDKTLIDYADVGFIALGISFFVALIIVIIFSRFKVSDISLHATQSSHVTPTSRLGGLAIVSAILFSCYYHDFFSFNWLWMSTIPILILGILEDVYFPTSSKLRLFIGGLSALIGVYLSQIYLTSIDIEPLGNLLQFSVIGISFTVFALVGLVNAINLIDGINGLALGFTLICSLALFLVAQKFDEIEIMHLCNLLFFATLGLFFLNFPGGRIFTGDAGVYSIGFVLGWIIIILAEKNTEIAKWSLLSIIIWPVIETLYSIYRRKVNKLAPDKPDFLHLHHVIMRAFQILSRRKISRDKANPLAALVILPVVSIPPFLGVLYIDVHHAGVLIVVVSAIAYILIYNSILIALKRQRFRKLFRI